jgi:pilus assembly protein Flp/PilA
MSLTGSFQEQCGMLPPISKGDVVMKAVMNRVSNFIRSEDGPTATEYAVMLALIIVVCLTAIGGIGANANTTFQGVETALGS